MKDYCGESVFELLNLNPQLFINEVLNIVDDLVDVAFNFFLHEASTLLKLEDTDRSADLSKGVSYIRNLIQSTLDQRMQKWEEYCLRVCFGVPEEFSLPKSVSFVDFVRRKVVTVHLIARKCMKFLKLIAFEFSLLTKELRRLNEGIENLPSHVGSTLPLTPFPVKEISGDGLPELDALTDAELDVQLDSLRNRLVLVGKESAELGRKVCELERQSLSSKLSAGSIDEELKMYLKHDATQLFQDLTIMASQFREKLLNLKRRRVKEIECDREGRVRARLADDVLRLPRGNGLFAAELEKLQDFVDEIIS